MRFIFDGLSEPFPISLFISHTQKHRANLQCPMNDSALCRENPKKVTILFLCENNVIYTQIHTNTHPYYSSHTQGPLQNENLGLIFFSKKQREKYVVKHAEILVWCFFTFFLGFSFHLPSNFLNLLLNVLSEKF